MNGQSADVPVTSKAFTQTNRNRGTAKGLSKRIIFPIF